MDRDQPVSGGAYTSLGAAAASSTTPDINGEIDQEAKALVEGTRRSALRPLDVDAENATTIAGMTPTAKAEYYKNQLVSEIRRHRDDLVCERQNNRTEVERLRSAELDYVRLKQVRKGQRVRLALAAIAALIGSCLISAFPSGTPTGLWVFSGAEMLALGWVLIGSAALHQLIASIVDT